MNNILNNWIWYLEKKDWFLEFKKNNLSIIIIFYQWNIQKSIYWDNLLYNIINNINLNICNDALYYVIDKDNKIYYYNTIHKSKIRQVNQIISYDDFNNYYNNPNRDLKLNLRKYQIEAINEIYWGFTREDRSKWYIEMATWTGKTLISAWIIDKLYEKNKKFLFLVDRNSLYKQTIDKFNKEYFNKIITKELSFNINLDQEADILVTTIQSLYSKQKFEQYINFFDYIIIDECHRSYFWENQIQVLNFFEENKTNLIWLTATPNEKWWKKTSDYFWDPLFIYSYQNGVKDWYLAKTNYIKYKTNIDINWTKILWWDFSNKDLGKKIDIPERNELIVKNFLKDIKFKKNNIIPKTIIFTASIQHAINLEETFNNFWINNNVIKRVDSSNNDSQNIIEEFWNKKSNVRILISVDMLSTWIDIPDIEYIIMARPTLSKILYTQMKWRWVRLCSTENWWMINKNTFTIIDYVDNTSLENKIITNDVYEEDNHFKKWWKGTSIELKNINTTVYINKKILIDSNKEYFKKKILHINFNNYLTSLQKKEKLIMLRKASKILWIIIEKRNIISIGLNKKDLEKIYNIKWLLWENYIHFLNENKRNIDYNILLQKKYHINNYELQKYIIDNIEKDIDNLNYKFIINNFNSLEKFLNIIKYIKYVKYNIT